MSISSKMKRDERRKAEQVSSPWCRHCKQGQTDSRHHRGLCRRMKRLSKNK